MIPYIGDISKADAELLKQMAEDSCNILEFGCGASTQVIAASIDDQTSFLSIDTSQEWMDKTAQNLELLGIKGRNPFVEYNRFFNSIQEYTAIHKSFDFIFDDGVDGLRLDFANRIWPYLAVGGIIAFHDTRRGHDFNNVLQFLGSHMDEVGPVYFNNEGSNITLVGKKEPEPYSNWQIDEKKEPWQLGYGNPPQEFIDSLK